MSSPNNSTIRNKKLKITTSSHACTKPNVVCRLFADHHRNIHFCFQSTLTIQFLILIYMFTKWQVFAIIVYCILPFFLVNAFYLIFISPIRLFKLLSIKSMSKSLRKVFTRSKKRTSSSSCFSINNAVSK